MKQDYPYIRAWGRMLNSMPYYIEIQVEQARKDKAPENATYYDDKAKIWHTVDDCQNEETVRQLKNMVKP